VTRLELAASTTPSGSESLRFALFRHKKRGLSSGELMVAKEEKEEK
jgi:hypothetical protein